MKRLLILLIILMVLTSCKTINIQKQEINQVQLLNIGTPKNSLTKATFLTSTQPNLNQKIRLDFSIENVSKTKITQLKKQDSTFSKTRYIRLTVSDKVALTQELNTKANKEVISLLKTDRKQQIITQLDLVINNKQENLFKEASVVYLIQNKDKQNTLEIHTKIGVQEIEIHQSTILNYQTAHFCWAENDKYQIQINSINQKCSKFTTKTYQKALKRKERDNIFRF